MGMCGVYVQHWVRDLDCDERRCGRVNDCKRCRVIHIWRQIMPESFSSRPADDVQVIHSSSTEGTRVILFSPPWNWRSGRSSGAKGLSRPLPTPRVPLHTRVLRPGAVGIVERVNAFFPPSQDDGPSKRRCDGNTLLRIARKDISPEAMWESKVIVLHREFQFLHTIR